MRSQCLPVINSDDPAYFDGYLNENYRAIQEALLLDRKEMEAIARNGFAASFLPPAEKAAALAAFDRHIVASPA